MWLSKDEFEKLTGKATKHDALVASILKVNEGMKADDVTPEFIEEAFTASDNVKVDATLSTKVTDLESEIKTLNATVTTVTKERDDFKSELENVKTENENLRALPGAESVVETTPKPKAEAGAQNLSSDQILVFAQKNPTDTAGIADLISKEGIENFKLKK